MASNDKKPSADRKTVCVSYETGRTVPDKKNPKISRKETKLLSVGSCFLTVDSNGEFTANGKFNAVPPNWDGTFVLRDPFIRDNGQYQTAEEPDYGDVGVPDEPA